MPEGDTALVLLRTAVLLHCQFDLPPAVLPPTGGRRHLVGEAAGDTVLGFWRPAVAQPL